MGSNNTLLGIWINMNIIFRNLISGRDFEKHVDRFFSGLALSGVDYLYAYSLPCDNPCLRIDFDNSKYLSRIKIWESGKCDVEAISFTNYKRAIDETFELKSISDFEDKLSSLIDFMKTTNRLH